MNFTDGIVFLFVVVLSIPACVGLRRKTDDTNSRKKKAGKKEIDQEQIWRARLEHIQSISTPYEQGQEIVGRIGALCGHMTHDEMYEIFEHARRIVRTREGFDREIH